MTITSNITKRKSEKSEKVYPWVGILNELIVLFNAPSDGMVLYCTTGVYYVGNYSRAWDEYKFKPYHGAIEISVD